MSEGRVMGLLKSKLSLFENNQSQTLLWCEPSSEKPRKKRLILTQEYLRFLRKQVELPDVSFYKYNFELTIIFSV